MEKMKRYAIYYAPEAGAFADAAASWLGWDPVTGQTVAQPELGLDLAAVTEEPRKYGFHGTIKPPFRLAQGVDFARLDAAVSRLAASLRPIEMPGLDLHFLERFLALTPAGDTRALQDLAARVVEDLDPLRAPLTEAEIARRRPERLSPRQRDLLDRYGYPFVMEEFRFHLTLSGPLDAAQKQALTGLAETYFAPHLPRPFRIAALCLFGEAEGGSFHLLHRYPLS